MDADRAVPILKSILARRDTGSTCLRRKAVFLVSQKRSSETSAILLSAVRSDPDQEVREQGVFWLSQVPGDETVAALDSILRDPRTDPEIQDKAIFALSQHNSSRSGSILRAYAERRDAPEEMREKAIFWLGQRHSPENAQFLKDLYSKVESDDLKEKIIFSLSQMGGADNYRWLMDIALNAKEDIEIRKKALFWAGQGHSVDVADLVKLYDSMNDREMKDQLLAFMASLNGKPNPAFCTTLPCSSPFNLADTLPQPNPFNSYDVTEKTYSFYTEMTFAGTDWSGNLGVRVVRTTTLAATAESVPTDIWTLNSNNSVQSFNVDYSTTSQFLQQATYTEALPSANLSYWVVPEQLQFRAAAGETISRPNLNQLAPNSTNQAINGTPELDYTGTAGLKPIKAWSVDLSLEWYYQPHAALNAALFGKKVTNDIYTGVQTSVDLGTVEYDNGPPGSPNNPPKKFLWTITAPANGAKSTYTGVELSWQHFLDNGLGTHMQYTHTWSKGYDQFGNPTGAVNQAPPTTFSVSLIYDKGPFNADVNWDYTSSYTTYCSLCTEVPGWPAIAQSFSWVTASAHYRIYKGFEVYVEGKNLTNAIARTYLNGNPLLPWGPGQLVGESASGTGQGYSAYGRSYVLGASYRF